MRRGIALPLAALLAVGAACMYPSGDVTGGTPRFDTGSGASSTDAGAGGDASGPEDLVDAGSGTKWTDLYRDFFGPSAAASCAGSGACHGDSNQSGARSSGGYVCGDQDGCRLSLLADTTGLVRPTDATAPEKSALVSTLRHRLGGGGVSGTMPKTPSYVFSHESLARIEAWIKAGAPND